MDLQEIKNLLSREKNAKIIIVENGKPVMVISGVENSDAQPKLDFSGRGGRQETIIEETENKDIAEDVRQSTEVIAKEEMPIDELRVEDLPF